MPLGPVSASSTVATLALVALTIGAPATSLAESLPIQVDGRFDDWSPTPFTANDPPGDAGASGIDFTSLMIANDGEWLFLRFDTGIEIQPDEQQQITLALDTDRNAATGASIGSLGAELVWNLGQRTGTFYVAGSHSVGQAELGLVVAPTVSGTELELAIRRDAVPAGVGPLFPGDSFTLALVDGSGGDALVVGMPGYTFDPTPQPVTPLALARESSAHIRIASYNIQNDGLTAGGSRAAALDRLFDAIDPDVWVICEAWNSSASEVAARVEQMLPSDLGETWYAVKLDPGNVIVSRFPILQSWDVLPGSRITAALLDPGPQQPTDLLLVANHWSCCTADANRQTQADALIAFLRDARTPGGVIDLAPGTPIVAAGDFNLVGWRAQLVTLVTGDIADNGTWGPDSPPDWDGSDFDQALPRHPEARFVYTWRNDGGSFYPGRLDYLLYSGSTCQLHRSFALETRSMSPAGLAAYGLQSADSELGSDHVPIVSDFTLGAGPADLARGDAGGRVALAAPMPNPFSESATMRYEITRAGVVDLAVFDGAGRRVRTLVGGSRPAGSHVATWDGRDGNDKKVPAGVYLARLKTLEGVAYRRLVRVR